ncbi:MAG TPA: PC4/YdbC family ssDNA-binding protein [Polyangiaceae bacterium]|nr:PC4/YdbC family ssDNA-binding protein [Polyangiaceae bacterium]
MPDLDELVSSQPRTRGALQVRRRTWHGDDRVDLRAWYLDAETGELKPGKGVIIKPAELRETIAALIKIAEAFETEKA